MNIPLTITETDIEAIVIDEFIKVNKDNLGNDVTKNDLKVTKKSKASITEIWIISVIDATENIKGSVDVQVTHGQKENLNTILDGISKEIEVIADNTSDTVEIKIKNSLESRKLTWAEIKFIGFTVSKDGENGSYSIQGKKDSKVYTEDKVEFILIFQGTTPELGDQL